jgi:ABC-type transport system involved in cytochrome bd biosynthesis fused ATPase/permease subunit
VIEAVLGRAGRRGVLVITHNLDALDGFDRVLRLERGTLSEVPKPRLRPAA